MLEVIKEFIAQYLPAITSVGGTVLAVVTFFANIKKILEKKDTETATLKESLAEVSKLWNDTTLKDTVRIGEITEELNKITEINAELASEIKSLKEQNDVLREIENSNEALKKQLTTILREKGE